MNEAQYINVLGNFCGKRDIDALTKENLKIKYGIDKADVAVLFGGSILCGCDVFAKAMSDDIAKQYIIVGGEGHTTENLRRKIKSEYPEILTDGQPEAKIFAEYLWHKYGLRPDFVETNSTNCGNNITNLLKLLKENFLEFKNIILIQDATMQCRMDAGLRRHYAGLNIINFAAYSAKVVDISLRFEENINGMWDIENYVKLLLGEIPRLTDDENGYGPKGKNFIVHVDIPKQVTEAFENLKKIYGVRKANPVYSVDGEILEYVNAEILNKYLAYEDGHGISHINGVIKNSMEISEGYDVNSNMVYMIAAYHDLGIKFGRKDHHISSAKLMMQDENLKKWFTDDEIILMVQAVEDHRASSEDPPRSIYGRIVSEADRDISPHRIIKRTIEFRAKDNISDAEKFEEAYSHLCEKYGKNGYIKLWLHTQRNSEGLEKLREWEADKEAFRQAYQWTIDNWEEI